MFLFFLSNFVDSVVIYANYPFSKRLSLSWASFAVGLGFPRLT